MSVKVNTSFGDNGSGFGGGWIKGILQQKAGNMFAGGAESTSGGGAPNQTMMSDNSSSYSNPYGQDDNLPAMQRRMNKLNAGSSDGSMIG